MAEVFTYRRQAGATASITYRVRETQMGDGYAQVIADGINNRAQNWPLAFEGSLEQMLEILAFFDRHAGNKAFYWMPPTETINLLFRVTTVSFNSMGGGVYRVSTEFKQVFTL